MVCDVVKTMMVCCLGCTVWFVRWLCPRDWLHQMVIGLFGVGILSKWSWLLSFDFVVLVVWFCTDLLFSICLAMGLFM